LENVIEHAFVIENSEEITPDSLPDSLTHAYDGKLPGLTARVTSFSPLDDEEDLVQPALAISSAEGLGISASEGTGFTLDINRLDFQANKEEFERQFLISALKAFRGRINQTALHANIPKKTLLRKLEKYGINARDYC
jgi:DNA-binding NtrC family response regulator